MKHAFLAAAMVVAAALTVTPSVSDAKRFGGGSSSGMQRSMPSTPARAPAAPQQAAPQQAYQAPAQGGYQQAAPQQGGYQQRPAAQPQGGYQQPAQPQQRAPMEPPIDFDDDIPF